MAFNLLRDASGQLRNGWWIAIFLILLFVFLVPLIVLNQHTDEGVPVWQQALAVLAVSLICQALRRRPVGELLGALSGRWLIGLGAGALIGLALMAVPAALLALIGAVRFEAGGANADSLIAALALFVAVAVTEELTFRGFVFQRLIDGPGLWPAQVITSLFFVLTHSTALAAAGALAAPAALNLLLASFMFGFAFVRTRSLAMPIGIHLMANVSQGTLFGFGVSGYEEQSVLRPLHVGPGWLTGGAFGLEASLPGLLSVAATLTALWLWRRT
jgi:membrane protease YdiL (CAAX protease family)